MKTWLVTGSSSGLGRYIAELVLERGERLVATARQIDRLADLTAKFGDRLAVIKHDVTDELAGRAAVALALQKFGSIDVLVNNAGYGRLSPFEQTSSGDFRQEIETNFYGVVNMIRAALPIMRRQRSGHILNISSSSGRFGAPGVSAYSAAKFAVGGFSESLAKEVAPFGVHVIAIEPGSFRTNWSKAARGSTPVLLPDYEPSVGALMKMTEGFSGHEPGDPRKLAEVLFDLSRMENLPEHLILGSDAIDHIIGVESAKTAVAQSWENTSRSTDFNPSA